MNSILKYSFYQGNNGMRAASHWQFENKQKCFGLHWLIFWHLLQILAETSILAVDSVVHVKGMSDAIEF